MGVKNILSESIRLIGFKLGNKTPHQDVQSFAIPVNQDGATTISVGGINSAYLDLEGTAKSEAEFINRYRDMAMQPECEQAIEDIVTDAIVQENNEPAIAINLDKLEQPDSVKNEIYENFDTILKLLNFNEDGSEIFKRWYIDGRLYYHLMVDPENADSGIQELRYLDPRRIRKVREVRKKFSGQQAGTEMVDSIFEYYVYNERGVTHVESTVAGGTKIATDSICYVHSGQIDSNKNLVVSYLHPAIKPVNQLRAMEDAHVIYRMSRAAERRVFYIDVGNMPTNRAEQYVQGIMRDFRNKLQYNNLTGEVQDDKRFLSMQEDIFLPRREGGKGTAVDTLPSGSNLDAISDLQYFQERLYKSLHVPISRLQNQNGGLGMNRSAEISRDEVKFGRFITKLRKRFEHLFKELLRVQLILKGVILEADWQYLKQNIFFDYQKDSVFTEAREQELLTNRMDLARQFDPSSPIGNYVSKLWIWKNIYHFNDEQIAIEIKQIKKEQPELDAKAEREASLNSGSFFDQPEGGEV